MAKASLAIYLGRKVFKKTKLEEKFKFDFLFGTFLFVVFMFISRAFYFYFDFYLTKLDSSKYYIMPNVIIWKMGTLFSSLGAMFILFILDKDGMKFRLKGTLAYAYGALIIYMLIYPVNSEEDFRNMSALGIVEGIFVAIIPITFLYLGIKYSELRKKAFLVVTAILIFAIAGLIIGENIVGPLKEIYGDQMQVTIFFLFVIMRIIGLSLLSYAVTQFYKTKK